MSTEITPIAFEDILTIRDLLARLYLELGEESSSIKFLDHHLVQHILANGKTVILKAVSERGEIIGLLSLTESQAIYAGGFYGTIDEIYVIPKHRSKRIGEQLIEYARSIGQLKKWKRIDVTGPTDGIERVKKFYEKRGFIITGTKLKLDVYKN